MTGKEHTQLDRQKDRQITRKCICGENERETQRNKRNHGGKRIGNIKTEKRSACVCLCMCVYVCESDPGRGPSEKGVCAGQRSGRGAEDCGTGMCLCSQLHLAALCCVSGSAAPPSSTPASNSRAATHTNKRTPSFYRFISFSFSLSLRLPLPLPSPSPLFLSQLSLFFPSILLA